jgi:hypothetical protein
LLFALGSWVHAGPTDAVARLISHGGSGTAIATGNGWTLILSCAHCFEGRDRQKPLRVNMPHPAPGEPKKVGLQVLAVGQTADLDLSLVKLNFGPVPYVTPVAPATSKPRECWSVGFDEMRIPPQCRPAKILRQEGNRYITDSRPWHGRSGGALIDKQSGYLVGVVSAYTGPSNHQEYDPRGNGIYVSLSAIHRFLANAGVGPRPAPDMPDAGGDPFGEQYRRQPEIFRRSPGPIIQGPGRH